MAWRYQSLLRTTPGPLVVDLGYGATPVTTHELAYRLRSVAKDLSVVGLEIDPARVSLAQESQTAHVSFALGGFEIPTSQKPVLIRALNVLRQYQEAEVPDAWRSMQQRLAPLGRIVEGTCDEVGRKAVWIELDQTQPISLTFAADLKHLDRPSDLAPRLPKMLIHHNIPGEQIHTLLNAMDAAWVRHSPLSVFSARQRWAQMVRDLRQTWPVVTPTSREKHGELTIDWRAFTNGGAAPR